MPNRLPLENILIGTDPECFIFNTKTNKQIKRTYNDFKIGLKVPGKLRPKRIRGGILLTDTTYEMR